MTVSPGNAGASIAPTSIAMRTTASNTRSTASDATAATNPTRGVSRVSANARATSPARAGRTLLTIMPTAVARQSSMNGNRGATGSRITRQRIARNGKVDVATAAASTNSPRFACARPERTSAKGMSLKVHQSSPALNAKPSAPRQPIRIEFDPFPRGREDPFPRGPHLAASSPRADVPTRWRIVHACGPVERKSATGSPRQQADEPDEGRWRRTLRAVRAGRRPRCVALFYPAWSREHASSAAATATVRRPKRRARASRPPTRMAALCA